MSNNLAFLESAGSETIGSFGLANNENGFDAAFESAVEELSSKNLNYFLDFHQRVSIIFNPR